MNAFAYLPDDEPFTEAPLFYVERPDARKHMTELHRVVAFRQTMRIVAPKVVIFANANAGKRSPTQARREGIRAGVFDYTCAWQRGQIAFIEFKGFRAGGRAGKLDAAQIAFGNQMHRLGFPVACFFSPEAAVEWLRDLGAPMLEIAG